MSTRSDFSAERQSERPLRAARVSGPNDRPAIWVVDDTALERTRVHHALDARYTVVSFADGATMIETLARGERPDALVLDWHMPVMSGLEVCRFVRESLARSALPILILTSGGHREDLVTALRAGANDYVTKPFDDEELNARLDTLVQNKLLHDEHTRNAALRETFIGILGHDLRQPLNTLVFGANTLLRGELPAAQLKTVQRLVGATQRMQRMIDAMLDLTRARMAGGIPITPAVTQLADACAELLDDLRLGHPGRAIELSATGDTEGEIDRDRVMQACTNLVANALEHGAKDAPVIVRVTGEQDEITLTVENAGKPIEPELLAHIFDPFRRGRAVGAAGLGLGLFIVEQIALSHGGSVAVSSSEGGTRFSMVLPKRARMPHA